MSSLYRGWKSHTYYFEFKSEYSIVFFISCFLNSCYIKITIMCKVSLWESFVAYLPSTQTCAFFLYLTCLLYLCLGSQFPFSQRRTAPLFESMPSYSTTKHPLRQPLGREKYTVGQCQANRPRMSGVQASESSSCETRECNSFRKLPQPVANDIPILNWAWHFLREEITQQIYSC